MPFDIDSFSRYLCFILPNKISLPPELDLNSFHIGVDPENLSFIINQFYKMFEPRFMPVIELTREAKTHTDTYFMKKVVARCVSLSEKSKSYGHFLLVCTLVKGVVEDHLDTAHCFFYPSLCYYCLISVYNRCYKEHFDSKEGTDDTLDSFITNLRQLLSMQDNIEDVKNLPIFVEFNIDTILEDLIQVEYMDFPLTEYEQESLEDLPALLPIVRSSARNHPEYKSSESLSECSSCRGIGTDDATECESMDEDSSSKPSAEGSVCSETNIDAHPSKSNGANCSEMTSFSSESKSSSSCKDPTINPGVSKSVSMESDSSSKSTSHSTDVTTSSMERDDEALRVDWEYYRERICDFCKSRCAVLPVNYITKTLGR